MSVAVRLAAVEHGSGPPVAILHGLFGAGRNWAAVAQRLAAHHRVALLDLRNHGASPWADDMNYAAMADDVAATMAALGHRRFALIGHSMGGKVAMAAALSRPETVSRLIVVDIAPVAYPPDHPDYVGAMRALDLEGITRRATADARLAPAAPDAAERAFLLQNLAIEEGHARWRLNLVAIERAMPLLAGFVPPASDAVYRGPALFVAGGRSGYLLPRHEPAVRKLFPNARIARIAAAGHWLQVEQPQAFLDLAEPFLTAA